MELYLQTGSMQRVLGEVTGKLRLSACLLEVFDASYIYEVNDFLSICMASLTTGVSFGMPHVALLNKVDVPLPPLSSSATAVPPWACSRTTSKSPLSQKWPANSVSTPSPSSKLWRKWWTSSAE
jgi:hypothetical protein